MTTTTANAHQIGGTHYARKAIQPWDYIIANQLSYMEGNVVRVARSAIAKATGGKS